MTEKDEWSAKLVDTHDLPMHLRLQGREDLGEIWPACPLCYGVKPSPGARWHFSQVGHRPKCPMFKEPEDEQVVRQRVLQQAKARSWFNWYVNRKRLPLNPTKKDLRALSWRRVH